MEPAILFHPAPGQRDRLKAASIAAGLPVSELLRRMIEHCCSASGAMDAVVPALSGHIQNVVR